MDTHEGFLKGAVRHAIRDADHPEDDRVLYILTMIVLALVAISFIIGAFNNSVGWGIAVLVVLAPLGFLLYLIVARIWLELVIVAFKINEWAQQISAHTATTAGSPPPPPPAITPGETGTPPATTGSRFGPAGLEREAAVVAVASNRS